MDTSKILKAVMLQNQINFEIDTLGQTSMEKANELECISDSFTSSEADLFVELCLESRRDAKQVQHEISQIVKTL